MRNASIVSDRAFVDTNVLVYAHDLRDPAKRERALELIERLSEERRMVVSAQVLNELCAVLLRGKTGSMANRVDLASLVDELEATAEVVFLTPAITKQAVQGVYLHMMAWYDALIWSAARAAGCTIVYSEDFQHGCEISGVRYINPFVDPAQQSASPL